MAEDKDDTAAAEVAQEPTEVAPDAALDAAPDAARGESSVALPRGWMYKSVSIFGHKIWYAHPAVQLVLIAFVCFLDPGMFNALGGLGGAGLGSTQMQDAANTALYSTFAIVGFFSGSITNRIGVRAALGFGGIGYCIYAAAFLCYKHTQNSGFVIFAGAWLGVCAGMLWTGQGTIMVAYPPEKAKGRYIAWFWIIFNLGAVIGSCIPLGQNIQRKAAGTVSDGTYAAFIVLMFIGFCLCFTLCNAKHIVRSDGSRVILMKNPSWWSEIKGLYQTIFNDPWVVLLFPMFFASNIFYTYQGNDMNGPFFDVRTRALNDLIYWLAQIFGAVFYGYLLDISKVRRSTRARAGWVGLLALTMAIWGGGYAWEKQQLTRPEVKAATEAGTFVPVDWTDGGKKYIGPLFLYFFYGFFDAVWQTSIYWYMGALSNSGRKAANLVGFYKGIQSAGAAVYWRLDGVGKPFSVMFGATWGLLAASLVFAAPIVFFKIKDTVTLEEDLKFSDETIEDAIGHPLPEKQVEA